MRDSLWIEAFVEGLASYRPDGPPSTSMTAEALYCRLLLETAGIVSASGSAFASPLQLLDGHRAVA